MSVFVACPDFSSDSLDEISFILFDQSDRSIANGSIDFFKKICDVLNIAARPVSWKLKVCRSDYFSDYLEEDDWRDVWRVTWKAIVKLDKEIHNIPVMNDIFIESDASDDSWEYEKRITKDSVTNCLVISDFRTAKNLDAVVRSLDNVQLKSRDYIDPQIKIYRLKVLNKYYQLQINLGDVKPSFYSNGASDAKLIQDTCKKHGGTTHYQKRFP